MSEPAQQKKRVRSGAGSVRQRGTTWTAAWSFADPATGKRVQRSKGGFGCKKRPRRTSVPSSQRSATARIGIGRTCVGLLRTFSLRGSRSGSCAE